MKEDMPMTPEDRDALVMKITDKMKDMTDEDLNDLAKEAGVDEDDAMPKADKVMPDMPTDVVKPVDTGVLAGPIPALKNFLIKSQRDNESQ